MRDLSIKMRISFLTVIASIVFFNSCENKVDQIPNSDLSKLPSTSGRDYSTIFTDSGKVQLKMSFPLMEKYENTEIPYYEFRKGIKVYFFDGKKDPVASATSKYAKLIESTSLWELRDSVVVINENNDKLETEVLFWNQQKDLIYTDRFVKITNEDQITQGFGFESDSHLQNTSIKKVSATIYINEE